MSTNQPSEPRSEAKPASGEASGVAPGLPTKPEEHGGPKGAEPTRYGDWEAKGICRDF